MTAEDTRAGPVATEAALLDEDGYLDFDLLVEKTADGHRARVLSSPAGQAQHDFIVPIDPKDIEILMLKFGQTRSTRRAPMHFRRKAEDFGRDLYEAVFDGEVRLAYRQSCDEAERQGRGLRLRLRFDDVWLETLPWEFLYSDYVDDFLVLSRHTPLVRFIEMRSLGSAPKISLPLRILVLIANPSDHRTLDTEAEWQRLRAAMGDRIDRGEIELVRVPTGSLAELRRMLQTGEFHIFHYIGHAAYDDVFDDGVLIMEGADGKSEVVPGRNLSTILSDQKSLRLAVLNACEGARTSGEDRFTGIAQSLIRRQLPAVIAMQFEITDEAAITLSRDFYGALVAGLPVDAALSEARRGLFSVGNQIEWATPVLYQRSGSGHIFDIDDAAPLHIETTPVVVAPPPIEAPPEVERPVATDTEVTRTEPPKADTAPTDTEATDNEPPGADIAPTDTEVTDTEPFVEDLETIPAAVPAASIQDADDGESGLQPDVIDLREPAVTTPPPKPQPSTSGPVSTDVLPPPPSTQQSPIAQSPAAPSPIAPSPAAPSPAAPSPIAPSPTAQRPAAPDAPDGEVRRWWQLAPGKVLIGVSVVTLAVLAVVTGQLMNRTATEATSAPKIIDATVVSVVEPTVAPDDLPVIGAPDVGTAEPETDPSGDVAAAPTVTAEPSPTLTPEPVPTVRPIPSDLQSLMTRLAGSVAIPLRVPSIEVVADNGGALADQVFFDVVTEAATLYEVEIAAIEGCGFVGACHIGSFGGRRLESFELHSAGELVYLDNGQLAEWLEAECGASCGDGQVRWLEGNTLYWVGLKAGSKANLMRLANAAIDFRAPHVIDGTVWAHDMAGRSVRIDGAATEWDGVTRHLATLPIFANLWDFIPDGYAQFAFGSDDANLYVLAEVFDDIFDQANTGTSVFAGDAVNVNIGQCCGQAIPGPDDFQLTVSALGDPDGPVTGAIYFGDGNEGRFFPVDRELPSDIDVAMTATGAGYNVEVAIPLSYIGPGENGILASINDSDGENRQSVIMAHIPNPFRPARDLRQLDVVDGNLTVFSNPSEWGTLAVG